MSGSTYALVELILFVVVAAAFFIHQYFDLKKAKAEREARERAAQAGEEATKETEAS